MISNTKLKKICIIGCGTYGSYLLKRLLSSGKNKFDITVIEIGDRHIKSEQEIGIESESKSATASQDGRYFGLGGTSARWGGQILFYDERDNPENNPDWQHIVEVNRQYKPIVIQNLMGSVSKTILEDSVSDTIKTGIWLKYTKRNTYKLLTHKEIADVRFVQNQRVIDFEYEGAMLKAVKCCNTEGVTQSVVADIFYLTAGAIESCRLMLNFFDNKSITPPKDLGKNYGDHLSVELFKISGTKPIINGQDFLPRFLNGSLITKRIIVCSKYGQVGFLHPIFNKDVKAFSALKQMLFGKQKITFNLKELVSGLLFLMRFGFNLLFFKKLYAYNNNWNLQLDIEQSYPNSNCILLSPTPDKFGQKRAVINWNISNRDKENILDIQSNWFNSLQKEGINLQNLTSPNIQDTKIEDVYHPVGFMRMGKDADAVVDYNCRVNTFQNLYHFSTAIFPSAKSINPTGAGFCLIEHHFKNFYIQ